VIIIVNTEVKSATDNDINYRTVKNFGREKTLANHNSPTFFANSPAFVTRGARSNVSCALFILHKDPGNSYIDITVLRVQFTFKR